MEAVVDQAAVVAPPPAEGEGAAEADALTERAQSLMGIITSSQHNPNPRVLHALASLLETEESRYVQEFGHSSFNNTRASHNIGRLGSLILNDEDELKKKLRGKCLQLSNKENEEFLDLVSSKFLSDNRFNTSVHTAASRLLLACSAAWMYPHVLDDNVLENIKHWVMDDTIQSTSEECNSKSGMDTSKPSDTEMLRTYATGLLTVSLSGGGQLVEDVLMSGLSSKLMRYLRVRVLGETSTSQKDVSFLTEGKHASGGARVREEGRSRFRQVTDTARLDAAKASDEGLLDDQITEKDHDRTSLPKQMHDKECREDGLPISARDMPIDDMSDDDEQVGAHKRDFFEEKAKLGEKISLGRSLRDEEMDENIKDESSRYKTSRAGTRNRGKERAGEVIAETERCLTSPGAATRIGLQARAARDRNQTKSIDPKRAVDTKKDPGKVSADVLVPENEDDDSNLEVKVGTVDVSDLVKKAKRAAEAEARAVNAPPDAVKAAGDAAVELVKTAALEAFSSTNNEEAVVEAAAKAASTVVEAAVATEVSRSQMNFDQEALQSSSLEREKEEIEGFFIPDTEFLAQLREKYCIQCLQILGEYVEVLGPVLHEKGVDVCLTLLQRNDNGTESSQNLMVLSDVLKLVCALAAHRKFAALFVDRGGMQRLLAVRRVSQTFVGLSSCLFAIGSLQGIMERFCALPSDVVHRVVELALQLLECSQDQARKNAALFFGAAFVFRAVLDSFDTQDGLPKLLNLLRGAAVVRSGVNSGSLGLSNLRNDRTPTEVLSASEKQIAYHTCVALRQYFRSHLLLLVDSLRPNKNHRSGARNISSARAAYKPLDISNEAMDAIFLLLQRDRKIGPAFVRVRWPPVDKFLSFNGHTTLLELCQAPPVDRYLHDLAQYALGVLHIVTLVPYSRRAIISSTVSNERVGMAVILDAANGAGYGDPEVIQPALNLLVNLCCPPPSLSNKLSLPQGPHASVQNPSGLPATDHKERHTERSLSDRAISFAHTDSRERAGEQGNNERGGALHSTIPAASGSQPSAPLASGVVGDRRISLGSGTGSAGLAAFMEQGYRQGWEAVRANNGIKVLLHLLHPRILIPPAALDCIRALACRVLLGLARDDSIAHILTKLQVGKLLSEVIRDSGGQTSATEQGRWQAELGQVAMELIAIVTNAGRASTLAATDAAAPTLRRIERAAIAAATPITYHARELLLLIHEHLVASGMTATAVSLLKEAQLEPLPFLSSSFPLLHQTSIQDNAKVEFQWPSLASGRFLSDTSKMPSRTEDPGHKRDSSATASKRKPAFSSNITCQTKGQLPSQPLGKKVSSTSKNPFTSARVAEVISTSSPRPITSDMDTSSRTPLGLPMKRKLVDRDLGLAPLTKRLATSDIVFHSPTACKTPISAVDNLDEIQGQTTPTLVPLTSNGQQLHHGFIPDTPSHPERVTLDSLVVQYLKHQHRQCPAPITTLPPLSLLHPHVCPEPSRRLDMPVNLVARLSTRESRIRYGGIHGHRRDRQFVFSRFRPWRTCRDEAALLTCTSFLGDASRIVTGSHAGELKIFDVNSSNVLESHLCHQTPVMLVQSSSRICRTWSDSSASGRELLLSSSAFDVRLWDSSSLSAGPVHIFEGRKAARFNHSGNIFATVASELSRREVFLYDVETCHLDQKLSDASASAGPIRSHVQPIIHFCLSDEMVLWNGILWDRRVSSPIHRFDQFTDYGGGGFHPSGNEVIINSEVWDLKKFKLLRSVPSLDQTIINFNTGGDIIYAMLRRNLEDITSAMHTRRVRHPLFAAFRTVDAVNYSDIATIPVDRCVLDFATEPSDSFVGVVAMDDHEEMFSSARLYEVGRRRSTDDDSDPDDGVETDEDDSEDDSEADEDPLVAAGLDADVDSDGIDLSNDDDDDTDDELDDADFNSDDDGDYDNGAAILELVSEDEGDDNQVVESLSSDDGEMGGFHDFHDLGF